MLSAVAGAYAADNMSKDAMSSTMGKDSMSKDAMGKMERTA